MQYNAKFVITKTMFLLFLLLFVIETDVSNFFSTIGGIMSGGILSRGDFVLDSIIASAISWPQVIYEVHANCCLT